MRTKSTAQQLHGEQWERQESCTSARENVKKCSGERERGERERVTCLKFSKSVLV